jgi:hypothetical protein
MHDQTFHRLHQMKSAAMIMMVETLDDPGIPAEQKAKDGLLFAGSDWYTRLDDLLKAEMVARGMLPPDWRERAAKLRKDARTGKYEPPQAHA